MSRALVRAAAVAVAAAVTMIATAVPAMAQMLEPPAGGAQPFGSSTWSDPLLKVLIVGVPVLMTGLIWIVLARGKQR